MRKKSSSLHVNITKKTYTDGIDFILDCNSLVIRFLYNHNIYWESKTNKCFRIYVCIGAIAML